MGLGQRLLTHHHNHGDAGGLIRRARLYETVSNLAFLGRRRRVYDRLVAASGARTGDRVLDVGCGTGYLTRRAARAVRPGGHVTGVDPSPPVIRYATRKSPADCTFDIAGAEALPYPDATFDAVISSLAIHHIAVDQRPSAFAEMYRVLRPGGRLFLADFAPPRNRLALHLVGALTSHAMSHNPTSELVRLAADAGFRPTTSGDQSPFLHYIQSERPPTRDS